MSKTYQWKNANSAKRRKTTGDLGAFLSFSVSSDKKGQETGAMKGSTSTYFEDLGKGQEGVVFRTKNQKAYKQYIHLGYHEYLASKYQKLHLLDGCQIEGYCMPEDIVVDQRCSYGLYQFQKISCEIIGYEMALLTPAFHMNDLSLEDRINILIAIVYYLIIQII